MPHHDHIDISGTITDVFAHRFVIDTGHGRVLADLGPEGAKQFALSVGLEIVASGEMKPSELKVDRIARDGDGAVLVQHKAPPRKGLRDDAHHPPSEARIAIDAVKHAGYAPLGAPRRKPKHFEVLARHGQDLVECHVELGGRIRKEKPVELHDPKWADELNAA